MEGGAMRGLFTCGVIDVMMENGICFDGAIGVSAGAAFGCNLKSRQIGRPRRYNEKYCGDKRYASVESWLKTGDLYNAEFCYHTLPYELDPWDSVAFRENPMEFWCVASDIEEGKPVYHRLTDGEEEDIQWIRASASIPVASRPVELEGRKLLDGGTTDPIPVREMEKLGYDRIVVVETQPQDFVKEKQKFLPAMRIALAKYPALIKALEERHKLYNFEKQYIRRGELAGEFLVIRPKTPLKIGGMVKDPRELERVYQHGRECALEKLQELRVFLEE